MQSFLEIQKLLPKRHHRYLGRRKKKEKEKEKLEGRNKPLLYGRLKNGRHSLLFHGVRTLVKNTCVLEFG